MNALTLTSVAPVRAGWLVDRRQDLLSTVGGLGASLVLLGLHLWGGVSSVVLWWAWILALDGPHIFATVSRTYLDRRERESRRRLLWGSLAWFAVGPLFVALSVAVGRRLPFEVFLAAAGIWAYWHVVRQHYGLMSLYQRKNGDMHPVDRRLDSLTLYVGLLAPFIAFSVTHGSARRVLGLGATPGGELLLAQVCWAAVLAVVALFAARQAQRWRAGAGINGPKVLLLAAAMGLSALLFSPPVVARIEFLMVAVVVTAFHNIQYHGIVWFYHRNRYHTPSADRAAFGLAPRVSQRFLIYAACGVAFTLIYRGLGCGFGAHPGCGTFDAKVMLGPGVSLRDLMVGFVWGFALHHYYLDQKIWRVSRDKGLNQDLKLSSA